MATHRARGALVTRLLVAIPAVSVKCRLALAAVSSGPADAPAVNLAVVLVSEAGELDLRPGFCSGDYDPQTVGQRCV